MTQVYDLSKYTSILDVRIKKIYFFSGVVHIETGLNKRNIHRLRDELISDHHFYFDRLYLYGNKYVLVLYGANLIKAVEAGIIQ